MKKKAITLIPVDGLDSYPVYKGNDLGLTYSKRKSVFKLWSPAAKEVTLRLYEKGEGGKAVLTKKMKPKGKGLWLAKTGGNKEGLFYTYQVSLGDTLLAETPGPYVRATGVNGLRGMIVDFAKTNPEGWQNDQRPPLAHFQDIILYELHLRDISVHENSGIKNKGKYLGLTETSTKTPDGLSTGLDHIKELGVTHVHLLPVFDFLSIDESNLDQHKYNWGYDPQNYNVPEGSYSTDPYDGRVRIREFKTMVKALHENGLRVIMDVVYNHTGSTENSSFNLTAPYYYYRLDENGFFSDASGCGNETASERPMMRKFMIESMKYWAQEYHVDGFRLDLMGIHDIETMNLAAAELHKIDPTIFIYGEGWTAGTSPLPEIRRAVKANAKKLKGVAVFSDDFRDGVKGNVFEPKAAGFATGNYKLAESVKFGITGAVNHPQVDYAKVNYSKFAWANEPADCINYVSCHDNHTLWDRLVNSRKGDQEADLLKMDKLAQTMVLTSQGIPFLLAGEEFVRTKEGLDNSYQSADRFNRINWDNKKKYKDLFTYYKDLIALRKKHPAFRMGTAEAIRKNIKFMDSPFDYIIGYSIDGAAAGDSWKRILVFFNGSKIGKRMTIPDGNWKMICNNYRISENGMGKVNGNKINLLPWSAYILAEE